jgi:hypothetical protein
MHWVPLNRPLRPARLHVVVGLLLVCGPMYAEQEQAGLTVLTVGAVLGEKPVVAQLVKNFTAFCGTRSSVTE